LGWWGIDIMRAHTVHPYGWVTGILSWIGGNENFFLFFDIVHYFGIVSVIMMASAKFPLKFSLSRAAANDHHLTRDKTGAINWKYILG